MKSNVAIIHPITSQINILPNICRQEILFGSLSSSQNFLLFGIKFGCKIVLSVINHGFPKLLFMFENWFCISNHGIWLFIF